MNQNKKVVKIPTGTNTPNEQVPQPKFPELFTDPEVADYGEVISTTEQGQVFVLKDNKMYLFQPVATRHTNHEEYYYQRVDFK